MDDIENAIVHNTLSPPWTSISPNATSAYSNITANDNSRVHDGHNFYCHQYYTVQKSGNDFAERSLQATLKRKRSLADIDANPRTRAAQESLDTALKKLGKLSLSIRHRKEGDAAEKIARLIAAVFEAITTHGEDETWYKTAARHLGKLGAIVKWEEQFDINSTPQRKPISRYAKAKTRRVFVQIGRWNISLTTITRDSPLEGRLCYVETSSILRVEPQHRSLGSALAVFFSECWDGRVASTIPPTVLAYNMVNDYAEVFQRITDDDLDGLVRLLACGEASIHDCDELGRSLLHYACHEDSVRCCSFLVDRGVDIGRFELSFINPYGRGAGLTYVSPLQVSIGNPAGYSGFGSCFDILWRAGADPTGSANSSKTLPPVLEILEMKVSFYVTAPFLHVCLEEEDEGRIQQALDSIRWPWKMDPDDSSEEDGGSLQ